MSPAPSRAPRPSERTPTGSNRDGRAARDHSMQIGIDVGSTTVKLVVVQAGSLEVLWQAYERHHAHQPERVLELLERAEAEVPGLAADTTRVFITGSGALPLVEPLGARFVQEVNAVTLAVERLHPDVMSVVELGGQDAKIILFKWNERTGERLAWTSMNDRCASGTGATIDKCLLKIGLSAEQVQQVHLGDRPLHSIAAKCGVFAEMDVVNLSKTGVPSEEILCSLGDAIVQQNLSLLARGNTLKPRVLLLGGPMFYFPFLRECWRRRIEETWQERGIALPEDLPPERRVEVPEQALFYAAYGAVVYGERLSEETDTYRGSTALRAFIEAGRQTRFGNRAGAPLVHDAAELDAFRAAYAIPAFTPPPLDAGCKVRAALGIDGGSTSTKAVLVDEEGRILQKAYRLSKGNPIQDAKELLTELKAHVEAQGAALEVTAFGATGYAAGVLESAWRADVNVVETVAHMQSAVHLFGEVDVICDVGGQDIKVLFLKNGELRSFRLSNQCSAGNGMLLQATAEQFGVPVHAYAEHAFQARLAPRFSYGCAVFLDSDRVNLQKEGFSREELMAGLAMVLPKNIWQYIVQAPRLDSLGHRYVLQGGTQYNLAAVKAQVDYIRERVPEAQVRLHPHPGEAGAIGAAMEAQRVVRQRGASTFVGVEPAIAVAYETRTDDSTRCGFCTNRCPRTFITTRTPDGGEALYISGFSCERGTVPDVEALKAFNRSQRERARRLPNLAAEETRRVFASGFAAEPLPPPGVRVQTRGPGQSPLRRAVPDRVWLRGRGRRFQRSSEAAQAARAQVRIGMPRTLDVWTTAPFWRAYFETLGVPARNLVFSRESGERMFTEGAKYGAVDPCYPGKVVQAHIHDLLTHQHTAHRPLHYIYFPTMPRTLGAMGPDVSFACPIVTGTPNVIKAAFTKEVDYFAARGIEYVDAAVNFGVPVLQRGQLHATWGPRLGITRDENDFAIQQGLQAQVACEADLQRRGREVLEAIEREGHLGVLLLSRPYHLDPGLIHGIPETLQELGYPVITLRSIPRDPAWLERFFRSDLAAGRIAHPLDISDVWPEAHTANSAHKVWGAKFAARHPHLAVVDVSSFKCGHDSPTYGLVDNILTTANVPYLALHDLDANRPTGTLRIRLRTFAHALSVREEQLAERLRKERELAERLRRKREELLSAVAHGSHGTGEILSGAPVAALQPAGEAP